MSLIRKIRNLHKNIASLSYLPHAMIYGLSTSNVKEEILCDILANESGLISCQQSNYVGFMYIARVLKHNSYLRTLYFHRIKHLKIRKFLWGKSSKFEIPYDVIIGPGVKLDHPFSTILNAKIIGKNLRIKNNITIGNKNDDENLRPKIGDNVYIGAGAIVIGDINIGNNVIIGAGTVVVKDIPDNCIAVGNPARILYK